MWDDEPNDLTGFAPIDKNVVTSICQKCLEVIPKQRETRNIQFVEQRLKELNKTTRFTNFIRRIFHIKCAPTPRFDDAKEILDIESADRKNCSMKWLIEYCWYPSTAHEEWFKKAEELLLLAQNTQNGTVNIFSRDWANLTAIANKKE